MTKIFEITFEHPDYSPLDSMPLGMNKRYILANSDSEAQTIFRSRYPQYKDSVSNIESTGRENIEDLVETLPWGRNIEAINQWDRDHGYVVYNTDIETPQIQKEPKNIIATTPPKDPNLKEILNLAILYLRKIFKKK